MMLTTPPGVYAPQHDTWLLTEALQREKLAGDTAVLDIGTGSGALALAAARHGAGRVTAVDVSARAVATAWVRARLEGLRIQVMRGDLLSPVADRRFDLIVANPPYIPSPEAPRGRAVAWTAGIDGRPRADRTGRGEGRAGGDPCRTNATTKGHVRNRGSATGMSLSLA